MTVACKTKNAIIDSGATPSDGKEVIETVGHFKMGLIDYEIVDSSIIKQDMAEMMIGMMKPSMESELIFTQFKSAEIVKTEENSEYARRFLYDRQNKKAFQFLSKDSVDYYSEMDMEELESRMKDSPEEIAELNKMFKIKKYEQSDTELFGFKCDEVTMLQPGDSTKVNAIAYTSHKIPHLAEAMGQMSKYFSGAPIRTVVFMNGLKVTIGAISYEENPSMGKYLDFDPNKYKKLSMEEFEEMGKN